MMRHKMMDDLLSREEVIKAIKDEWDGCSGEYNSACIIRDTCEAIDRVASAQPEIKTDEDTISRAEAIEIVNFECGEWKGLAKTIVNGLKKLPSAQPETNCSEIPNNSDLISRQAAIDAICAVCGNDCDKSEFVYNAPQDEQVILCPEHYCLCNLPSTQPERKMGHWIYEERKRLVDETDDGPVYRTEKWWSCSECGYAKGYQISKPSSNYCENCGAKMLKDGE